MHHRRTSHRRFATAMLSRLLVLVAAAIAGACGAGGAGSDLETARLEPVLELRIGSVDDPDDWLTRFDHLVVGPDGRIYTPHEQEKLIRVHDAEGRLVRAFGREGAGPGEFRRLDAIGLLGDTLWVFDMGNSRFSYFTLDGEPIGHRRVTIDPAGPERSPPMPVGHFSDGTIRGDVLAPDSDVAAGRITDTPILRIDEKSEPLDTVAIQHLTNTTLGILDPTRRDGWGLYTEQPYSDTRLTRFSPIATEVVYVDRAVVAGGAPTVFRVTQVTFDGDTIFSRTYPYAPRPIDPAMVDSIAGEWAERLTRFPIPGSPTAATIEKWFRDALYLPDHHPPVSDAFLGHDGTIWLKREPRGDDAVDWLVLAYDGEPIGTIALPGRLTVMAATRDAVWGMELDDLDVPYIVRYGVRLAGDGATDRSRSS